MDDEVGVLVERINALTERANTNGAAMLVLLGLLLEVLFILMDAKVQTSQQCLERLRRVHSQALNEPGLAPAAALAERLVLIAERLAAAGYPDVSGPQREEAESEALKFLRTWAPPEAGPN